jgi:hypothetical protein
MQLHRPIPAYGNRLPLTPPIVRNTFGIDSTCRAFSPHRDTRENHFELPARA